MDRTRMTSVEIQAYSVEEAVRLALEQLGLGNPRRYRDSLRRRAGRRRRSTGPGHRERDGLATGPAECSAGAARGRPRPRRPEHARAATVPRPPGSGRPPLAARRHRRASGRGRRPASARGISIGSTAEEDRWRRRSCANCSSYMGIDADVRRRRQSLDDATRRGRSTDDLHRHPRAAISGCSSAGAASIWRSSSISSTCSPTASWTTWTRVIVDVEGYRTRREESLIGLAERVARQVARSRRPIVLEPMPPNERRIVHLTLRSNPDVTTESTRRGQSAARHGPATCLRTVVHSQAARSGGPRSHGRPGRRRGNRATRRCRRGSPAAATARSPSGDR